MIEIIENNNYNKPVDNYTVVKMSTSNGYKKLFKVFDGIWLDPTPVIQENKSANPRIFTPYEKDYCQTIEQKSKYLEQMTILFKRINSIPLGQGLLEDLYKGSPVDFSNYNTWTKENTVLLNERSILIQRKLRATCIISPNTQYLENQAIVNSRFGLHMINTSKANIFFHPDCIYSIRKGKNIIYCDPVIPLVHELIHVLHHTYSILGFTTKEEEYITFGAVNSDIYLDPESRSYHDKLGIMLHNLDRIKRKINKIPDIEDRQYFEEKYGFTINNELNITFAHNYIERFQDTYSEYDFAKQFGLKKYIRANYDDRLFLPFKFDISDPKVYTLKQGLLNKSNDIHEISKNPSNIFLDMGSEDLHSLLNKYRKKLFKRSLDTNQNNQTTHHKGQTSTLKSLGEDVNLGVILQNISTVQDKINEIPQKIMGKYAQTITINNIKEDTIFNKPPKHVEVTEYIETLNTFKVADLVGFDRIKPTDILTAHRINNDLLYSKEPIYFTSEDLEKSVKNANVSFTYNRSISTKMDLMEKGKAVLRTGNAVLNIVQFGMWVDEIIEDFTEDNYKDAKHIVTDVLSIAPYLGQLMSIHFYIKEDNYLSAIKGLGILALLEVFPELLLPVFLIDSISSSIINNEKQKEVMSKAIWNILIEREQLLDTQLNTESKDLANICIERIKKIADHIEKQLDFNVQAIIHNIKTYGHAQYKSPQDSRIVDDVTFKATQALFVIVQEKRSKVIETLFQSLRKTIVEDFKVKSKGQINKFNEQTKIIIKRMLEENNKYISTNRIEMAFDIVEKYMKKYNVDTKIQKELDTLSSMLNTRTEILLNETTHPLAHTHIGLNQDNKAVNKLNNTILSNQNINYQWGRKGNAICFKSGNSLQIQSTLFSHLNALKDFTIDFWVKVPLTKGYDTDTHNEIPLIKNGSNGKIGWSFNLNNRYITFSMYKKHGMGVTIGNYLIAHNKWTKITVVNNNSTKMISFFINGEFFNELATSWISSTDVDLEIDNVINIGLPGKNNLHFILDDFKVYNTALKYVNISMSYANDKTPEILYDYFGNSIKKDRQYVLANYSVYNQKYYPITQLKESSYWVYNDIENATLQNYDFTISFNKEDNNVAKAKSKHPDIIYKNNNVTVTSYNKSVIWGAPKDYEEWGIEENDQRKYYIHINNNLKILTVDKIYGIDAELATHNNADCVFKVFNMFDYVNLSGAFNNKNAISLALYKRDILTNLLVHHNKEILALEGVLKNNTISDAEIIIEKPYHNVYNDLEDYTYKSLFYLFPVDELEYYIRLYE